MPLTKRTRVADRWLLYIRNSDDQSIAAVEITEAEHDTINSVDLTAKVIAEKRVPPGNWEHNSGGTVMGGGVWTFSDGEPHEFNNAEFCYSLDGKECHVAGTDGSIADYKDAEYTFDESGGKLIITKKSDGSKVVDETIA